MQVAAAALVALAAASAAAGWYVFGAVALGVGFILGMRRLALETPPHMPQWLSAGLTAAVGIGRVALAASVFAAYLFPTRPVAAGAGMILVVTVADAAGVHLEPYYRRWLAGILLVTLAVFLAVCLAIAPVPAMTFGNEAAEMPDVAAGSRALAVVIVPLSGLRAGTGTGWRRYASPVVAVAGVVAVAAASMYQLGAVRFGLSPTSLRTVFVAADARALLPVLAIAVAVTTVPAALDGLGQSRSLPGRQRTPGRTLSGALCGLGAAALVVVSGPVGVLLVCAVLLLGYTLGLAVTVLLSRRSGLAVLMILVAGALLSALPPVALLSGLAVAVVGVAAVCVRRRVSESF